MVLTQLISPANRRQDYAVSIPLWFSRNAIVALTLSRSRSVSIPLWFSRNPIMQVADKINSKVSIPLWFSRNIHSERLISDQRSFHTTMVLTQPERLRMFRWWTTSFHTTMVLTQLLSVGVAQSKEVSIPLWFSRNGLFDDLFESIKRFHTTMVLTQRIY